MKELSPNLYGIIVPIDSFQFSLQDIDRQLFLMFVKKETIKPPFGNTIRIKGGYNSNSFEIIGTASEKEITFDSSNYVENMEIGYRVFYLMYTNKKVTQYPNKSLLSLIKSKGIELKPNEKLLVIKKKAS